MKSIKQITYLRGMLGDFYCFHGQTMRFDLLALFGV